MKKTLHALLLSALLLTACQKGSTPIELAGNAQGTTFSIKYHAADAKDYSAEVATMLGDIDKSMSLWRDDSYISQLNASEERMNPIPNDDRYFAPVLAASIQIHHDTRGAFDPSVYPLVRAWGFGAIAPDSDTIPDIDSLISRHHIGPLDVNLAEIGPDMAINRPVGMQLDFNGIAQGYSVDVLADFLESKGVTDYMVEIGGELKANGLKPDGTAWRIGIDRPQDGPRELERTLELSDAALATSGSYRKYNERDGKRYSHCIDPRTGRPVEHTLLSVTVIAETCMLADAYATSFMVMGVAETMAFLKSAKGNNLEVLLIYDEGGENKSVGTGRLE